MADTWIAVGRTATGGPPWVLVATSPDGITWTAQTTPDDGGIPNNGANCVATDGAGTWLMGVGINANSAAILMSTDGGVTWTTVWANTDTDSVWAITWAGSLGLWVAGLDGSPSAAIATSPDGLTWTVQTTPFDGANCGIFSIGWDGTTLVAAGQDAAVTKVIMTSTDGITWTARTTPFDGGDVFGVAWCPTISRWVATGEDSGFTKVVMTSPDAVTWTAQTTPNDGASGNCVTDNGSIVVVGTSTHAGHGTITSTNGTSWTARTQPWDSAPSPGALLSVAWSGVQSQFVAGANIGNQPAIEDIATSPDGITWTGQTSPFDGGNNVTGLAFGTTTSGHQSRTAADSALASDVPVPGIHVSGHAHDTAHASDAAITGSPLGPSNARPLVVAQAVVNSFLAPPTPAGPQGPVGNHEYEVIICDKYGLAFGQIASAVVTEVDFELDDIGQAMIDFWIFDPTALLLDNEDLPGGKEIQIWRDQRLWWWGVPVTASFDPATVHLTCQGLTWYFGQRNFGPNPSNYIVNSGFEGNDPNAPGPGPGWSIGGALTAAECLTLNKSEYGSQGLILEGDQALQVGYPLAVDAYIYQRINVSTGVDPVTYDFSGWVYVPSWDVASLGPFKPPFGQRGLFMQMLVGGNPILGSPQSSTLDGSTPQDTWTRMDCSIIVPPHTTGQLEVRCYAGASSQIWDALVLTADLAVGMKTNLSPGLITAQLDVLYIMRNILLYAQDEEWGKSDLAIPIRGGLTGTRLIRLYQLSDNGGILDALNEFPSIGVCDFNMRWDATGHFRWLQVDSPATGRVRYNFPLEVDVGNLTDLQGAVDGSQVGTAARVLGQGSSGSSLDIGYAAFPSYLGGKVQEHHGHVTLGSTTVVTNGGFFVPSDVGKAIYSLAQALPVGTIIASYINSGAVTVTTPKAADPSQGGVKTIHNDTIGVGGVILDNVQSAIQDLPIGTLQGTAQQTLIRNLASLVIPTAKFKDDTANSPWATVGIGDVVPVSITYGWLRLPDTLMRIVGLAYYPQTDEVAPTLNPVNASPT